MQKKYLLLLLWALQLHLLSSVNQRSEKTHTFYQLIDLTIESYYVFVAGLHGIPQEWTLSSLPTPFSIQKNCCSKVKSVKLTANVFCQLNYYLLRIIGEHPHLGNPQQLKCFLPYKLLDIYLNNDGLLEYQVYFEPKYKLIHNS